MSYRNSIVQELEESIEDRLDLLGIKLMNSSLHQPLVSKQKFLYIKIRDSLSTELQQVLLEYDDLYGDIIALTEKFFYEYGFKDGITACSRRIEKTKHNSCIL